MIINKPKFGAFGLTRVTAPTETMWSPTVAPEPVLIAPYSEPAPEVMWSPTIEPSAPLAITPYMPPDPVAQLPSYPQIMLDPASEPPMSIEPPPSAAPWPPPDYIAPSMMPTMGPAYEYPAPSETTYYQAPETLHVERQIIPAAPATLDLKMSAPITLPPITRAPPSGATEAYVREASSPEQLLRPAKPAVELAPGSPVQIINTPQGPTLVQKSGYGLAIAGAVGGAVAGGPIGAAVGGAIGLLLSKFGGSR